MGAPGLLSPPAAGDWTGAELLTRIIRYLHGYCGVAAAASVSMEQGKIWHYTEGQRCLGMGREQRPPPGAARARSPAQGWLLHRLGTGSERSFKPSAQHTYNCLCLAKSPQPHPAKPPPPISGRCQHSPSSTRGRLRHGAARGYGQRGAAPPSPRLTPRRASQSLPRQHRGLRSRSPALLWCLVTHVWKHPTLGASQAQDPKEIK